MTILRTSSFSDAQREMPFAYYGGGAPGMFTSAAVWLAAGLVSFVASPRRGIWVLLIGGALIHPLSVLLLKAIGRSGKPSPGNPLGLLALATTFWLVLSCVLALTFPSTAAAILVGLVVNIWRGLCFSSSASLRFVWPACNEGRCSRPATGFATCRRLNSSVGKDRQGQCS